MKLPAEAGSFLRFMFSPDGAGYRDRALIFLVVAVTLNVTVIRVPLTLPKRYHSRALKGGAFCPAAYAVPPMRQRRFKSARYEHLDGKLGRGFAPLMRALILCFYLFLRCKKHAEKHALFFCDTH